MSDKTEYDAHWADDTEFTWRDYVKAALGLIGLAALIWWTVR